MDVKTENFWRSDEKRALSIVSSKIAADAFGVLKNGCESRFLKNSCGRLRRPQKVAVRCVFSKSGARGNSPFPSGYPTPVPEELVPDSEATLKVF